MEAALSESLHLIFGNRTVVAWCHVHMKRAMIEYDVHW
jgi:hypothetical protein